MTDLKSAVRGLLRSPVLTSVACLSLALGFGVNTALFSIFTQVLRRPLPVRAPEQLVNLAAPGVKYGGTACDGSGDCDEIFSYPMFRDLERAATSPFSGLAAFRLLSTNVATEGLTADLGGFMVSGSYFSVLGLNPALGRLITQSDVDGGDPYVVVLSHSYWSTAFAGDRTVIGKRILIGGNSVNVIGVAPKGFDGNTLGVHSAFYVPLTLRAKMGKGALNGLENRKDYFLYLFGRLKPGVTLDAAGNAINAVYQPILRDVELPLHPTISAETRKQFAAKRVTLAPGELGQSALRKDAAAPLRLLFALTGLVVLIACANVANLLLIRATVRKREIAMRVALGASRARIMRLLLTESVLLAVVSGAVGLLVAYGTLVGATRLLPPDLATSLSVGIDAKIATFVAFISISTGVLFGLAPALHAGRADLRTMLAGGSKRSEGRDTARTRTTLVTLQVAMSMALLLAGGLFLKSLRNIGSVDLGVDPNHVMTFRVSPGNSGYDTTRTRAIFARIEEELRAIPGTNGATASLVPLFADENWNTNVNIQGYRMTPDEDMTSQFNRVGTGYFSVLRMPLLKGRDFADRDVGGPQVAIVNEAFVKRFALGAEPLGRRVGINGATPEIEIVGVARNARYGEVKTTTPPMIYLQYRQSRPQGSMVFFVRTERSTEETGAAIRRIVAAIDPALPVQNLRTLPDQIRENVFLDRTISILATAFACLATLLASIGLYGVISQSVLQRTREIGVRIALGLSSRGVRMLVMRQVAVMTVLGGLLGIYGGLAFGRAARTLLFEMSPVDPGVMLVAFVVLVLVTTLSGYLPARRASHIHPMEALRHE